MCHLMRSEEIKQGNKTTPSSPLVSLTLKYLCWALLLCRQGWRWDRLSRTALNLLSLDFCISPLSFWVQILGRGLNCNSLSLSMLLSFPPSRHARRPRLYPLPLSPFWCLLLFLLAEEGLRVPVHVGGVQQCFQGVRADQRGATPPRAAPASVAEMSWGSHRLSLGDGDVRESQLKGVLAWCAPDGRGRGQSLIIIWISISALVVVRPLPGCLQLVHLWLLVSAWMDTKSGYPSAPET